MLKGILNSIKNEISHIKSEIKNVFKEVKEHITPSKPDRKTDISISDKTEIDYIVIPPISDIVSVIDVDVDDIAYGSTEKYPTSINNNDDDITDFIDKLDKKVAKSDKPIDAGYEEFLKKMREYHKR